MDRHYDSLQGLGPSDAMRYDKDMAVRQAQFAQNAAVLSKPSEPPHTLAMRDALSTAHQISGEAYSLIINLTERLFGSAPMNASGSASQIQAVPNGAADEALQSARALCDALGDLRAAVSRLEARL